MVILSIVRCVLSQLLSVMIIGTGLNQVFILIISIHICHLSIGSDETQMKQVNDRTSDKSEKAISLLLLLFYYRPHVRQEASKEHMWLIIGGSV